MNLSAQDIKKYLAEKYSPSKGFAYFPEFRTLTGYANARFIDAVAVGLWSKNNGIWAFEIKINRGDFIQDVSQFQHKHADALEISHRFYYVCPWGLIDKNEVPDVAGLIWVNKAMSFVIKKQAQLRVKQEIPMPHFLAFAQKFGSTIEHSKIPVKYLDKEISQDDFLEIVEEKKKGDFDFEVRQKAREVVQERNYDNAPLLKIMKEVKGLCRCYRNEDLIPEIQDYISKATLFDGMTKALNDMANHISRAQAIIDKTNE